MQFFVLIDGNASAIVAHGDGVVLTDNHFNVVAETRQGLVDGVVNDFAHQVVQALDVRVANVHGWTLAHGFKSFENLDVVRRILLVF